VLIASRIASSTNPLLPVASADLYDFSSTTRKSPAALSPSELIPMLLKSNRAEDLPSQAGRPTSNRWLTWPVVLNDIGYLD
jgi:hypothetical protein